MHKFIAGSLLSVSLACLPLAGNAADAGNAKMSGAVAKPLHLSCEALNGVFRGDVKGHYYDYGSSKGIYITQYKMYQDDELATYGPRANINLIAFSETTVKEVASPDNRKQDNQWHSVRQNIPNISGSRVLVRVNFVFDRPGKKDPTCTAELMI